MKAILSFGVLVVSILVMLMVGMELEGRHFREVVQRKWILVSTLAAQIIFLPVLGLTLISEMALPSHLAAGILLLAASPVGNIANFYMLLANANVALSVSLNTLSCLLSFVTMAVTFESYTRLLGKGFEFAVPAPTLILRLTLMVVLPVLVGMVLRRFKPEVTARCTKTVRNACLVGLAFMLIYVMLDQRPRLVMDWKQTAMASVVFMVLALLGGLVFGRRLRLSADDCLTVGNTFAGRNVALATTIAVTILNRIEYAVFATVYFLTEVPLLLTVVAAYRRWSKGALMLTETVRPGGICP